MRNYQTRRRGWRDRHHVIPKVRGGCADIDNMLLIKRYRHVEWHKLFFNLTLNEVIELLIRVQRATKNQRRQ
jgi:hypothetical protein